MIDPKLKDAKMKALMDLKSEMSGMMSDDVKGLKKVTVASPDKSGLAMGLDKAKEMVGKEESPEHEAMESSDEEKSEHLMPEAHAGEETPEEEKAEMEEMCKAMSPEELKAHIESLQQLLAEKQAK